jgi:hypothetical protein
MAWQPDQGGDDMRMKGLSFAFIAAICGLMMFGGAAQAQATRTWVSGVGDDANPCSRTAPCKTFAGAISKTAGAGIINCIDAAGFGAVTITKSITIDCRNTNAGIVVSGTNGINIPTANIIVNLRGLDIEGVGTGLIGVNITGASTIHIEKTNIYGFQAGTATGINFAPTAAGGRLIVDDCHIHTNFNGIVLNGGAGSVDMVVRNSVLDTNTGDGIAVTTTANHAGATIDRTLLAFNGVGLALNGAQAIARIGNSTVTGNGTGMVAGTGTLQSFKNNQIAGNNPDGTPITAFPGPGGPLQ